MALFGTDLSTYNGDVNFDALKRAGVKFAMVKATQGHSLTGNYYMFSDSKFKRNVEGLYKVGIPVGAYHFLTASTSDECTREAEFFLKTVEPYRDKLTLYLACDAENYNNKYLLGLSRDKLTSLIDEFCRRVEAAGYPACHYTNTDHIASFINLDKLDYPIWQAHYGTNVKKPTQAGNKLAIHQYTGTGTLPGVTGIFDLNFGYGPLATLIIRDRCGYEDQTFDYINRFKTGEDILIKLADKLVDRALKPIRDPSTIKLASLMRYCCGFDKEQSDYLLAYKYAEDLYRKMYNALLAK